MFNGENKEKKRNHVQNEIGMQNGRTEHKIKLDFVIANYGCMSAAFPTLALLELEWEFAVSGTSIPM